MQDDREWVQVEVLWDDGLGEEVEWDESGWEDEPLFKSRLRLSLPFLPEQQRRAGPARAFGAAAQQRDAQDGPRRKQKESGHLTKRRRKKLRAWELEDEA